jgi:LysR substrate binding domain.
MDWSFTNFSTAGSTFICGKAIPWRNARRSHWKNWRNTPVCLLNREEITPFILRRRFWAHMSINGWSRPMTGPRCWTWW